MRKGFQVIILWGGEEIEHYYDYCEWSLQNVSKILDHVKVYEFNTEDEAEAFREGMCAVLVPTARDFCELPPAGYEALLNKAKQTKKIKKAA